MNDYKHNLICLVQKTPLLWDPRDKDYKNKDQRKQGWEKIDEKLPSPVEEGQGQARHENTTLNNACRNGNLLQVKHILSQGTVNIDKRGKYGRTPAMIAAKEGHKEILELLVHKGSDLSKLDDDENNILHLATKEGHLEIVKYIHALGTFDMKRKRFDGKTPIMLAALFGQREVFFFLLKIRASLSLTGECNENILHLSCQGGDEEIVKYVVKHHVVDINSKQCEGLAAVSLAAKFGNSAAFEYLVETGADLLVVDIMGYNVFHLACQGGDMDIAKSVLKQSIADINSRTFDGRTPVLVAAKYGHSELINYLVEFGADLSVEDKYGVNVLHLACERGDMDTVKYVLNQAIVDVNNIGDDGCTPALIAAANGHSTLFEYLANYGADLSVKDDDGNNILHLACLGGDMDIVKYILNLNVVDINSKGADGYTPAMLAMELEMRDVFDLLVQRGADVPVELYEPDNVFHLDMITFCMMCCHIAWQI